MPQLSKPSDEFKSSLVLFPSPAEPLQPTFGGITRLSLNSVLTFPGCARTCSSKAQFHSNQEKRQVLSYMMGQEKHAYCFYKCTDSCKSEEFYTKENSPTKREKKTVNFWCKENDIPPPPPPKKNVQSCGKIKCNILRAEV